MASTISFICLSTLPKVPALAMRSSISPSTTTHEMLLCGWRALVIGVWEARRSWRCPGAILVRACVTWWSASATVVSCIQAFRMNTGLCSLSTVRLQNFRRALDDRDSRSQASRERHNAWCVACVVVRHSCGTESNAIDVIFGYVQFLSRRCNRGQTVVVSIVRVSHICEAKFVYHVCLFFSAEVCAFVSDVCTCFCFSLVERCHGDSDGAFEAHPKFLSARQHCQ